MSDNNGDTGSKDRATVALVNAKLDEVKAIIEGHASTTRVQLESVVKSADGLAARVSAIESEQRAQSLAFMALRDDYARHKKESDERIDEAEERGRFWRRAWPPLFIAAVASVPGWVALFIN